MFAIARTHRGASGIDSTVVDAYSVAIEVAPYTTFDMNQLLGCKGP